MTFNDTNLIDHQKLSPKQHRTSLNMREDNVTLSNCPSNKRNSKWKVKCQLPLQYTYTATSLYLKETSTKYFSSFVKLHQVSSWIIFFNFLKFHHVNFTKLHYTSSFRPHHSFQRITRLGLIMYAKFPVPSHAEVRKVPKSPTLRNRVREDENRSIALPEGTVVTVRGSRLTRFAGFAEWGIIAVPRLPS